MNPSASPRFLGTALLFSAALAATSVSAATIPFVNNFGSSGFANGNLGAPTGGALSFSTTGTSAVARYGTEQFTNFAGKSFTLETVVRITAFGTNDGGDTTAGFVLFANNGGEPSTAGTNYLLADWTYMTNSTTAATDGRLRFLSFTGTSNTPVGTNGRADGVGTDATRAALLDTDYTLRVTVTNVGLNTYNLEMGVFLDGSQIGTSASYLGFVSTNDFFGVRARNARSAASTGTHTVTFDSFSAIPEPSAFAALAGLGALGFAASRRRRA